MILLAHLMRNNSQVGLNAFRANGEIVVNVCMYKHDTCIVHDVLIMSNSCPGACSMGIQSQNGGS